MEPDGTTRRDEQAVRAYSNMWSDKSVQICELPSMHISMHMRLEHSQIVQSPSFSHQLVHQQDLQ